MNTAPQASLPQLTPEQMAMLAAARPRLAEPRPSMGLEMLLKVEAETRRVATVKELTFFIANETMKVTRSRQVFVFQGSDKSGMTIAGVSAVSHVDPKVGHLVWIASIVRALGNDVSLDKARAFQLPAYTAPNDQEHKTYPFRDMVWLPFKLADGHVFGGMLLARDIAWAESDIMVADRLAETYGHSWAALVGPRKIRKAKSFTKYYAIAGLSLFALAGFYPVPMTVLAPLEIAAVNAKTVAAPLDGIVEAVLVDPNTAVSTGTPIIRMSDTALRNEQAIAQEEVTVSESRLKLVMQSAVNDHKMRREIAIARADVALKKAKLNFASDMLKRTIVLAPADGVVVYTDRRDWQGRPVQTGERILDVADPTAVELRIYVPLQDSIAVQAGTKVRAFLDSDPVNPASAIVTSASYEARPHSSGVLAYQVIASLENTLSKDVRLGTHGTAQVSGRDVPLAFWLFRKPLTTMRQWLGL
jgi:multidrug resistance efflux pump